jgi:hypothetical protein
MIRDRIRRLRRKMMMKAVISVLRNECEYRTRNKGISNKEHRISNTEVKYRNAEINAS